MLAMETSLQSTTRLHYLNMLWLVLISPQIVVSKVKKVKSKVDNLYSGSKRPDQVRSIRCRTASTILPLFIGLHAMAATNGVST